MSPEPDTHTHTHGGGIRTLLESSAQAATRNYHFLIGGSIARHHTKDELKSSSGRLWDERQFGIYE